MTVSNGPAHKQGMLEGAIATLEIARIILVENKKSDAVLIVSALSSALEGVKQNCEKFERELATDERDGVEVKVGGRKITPGNFTAAEALAYSDLHDALGKLKTECSVLNFKLIVQQQRELLFSVFHRADSMVTPEEIDALDIEVLGGMIGAIASASLLHLWTTHQAWPKPSKSGPVN